MDPSLSTMKLLKKWMLETLVWCNERDCTSFPSFPADFGLSTLPSLPAQTRANTLFYRSVFPLYQFVTYKIWLLEQNLMNEIKSELDASQSRTKNQNVTSALIVGNWQTATRVKALLHLHLRSTSAGLTACILHTNIVLSPSSSSTDDSQWYLHKNGPEKNTI